MPANRHKTHTHTRASSLLIAGAVSLPALALGAPAAHADALGIGNIGDSYSESYVFHSDRTASQSWSDQIGSHGVETNTNFGSVRYQSGPVAFGYAHDWAYGGATTQNALDNQVSGLDQQVGSGQVQAVVVALGLNDMGQAEDFTRYTSAASIQQALDQKVATVTANIQSLVHSLEKASPAGHPVHIVIGNIPDATATPNFQNHQFANPQTAQLVRDAIQRANADIQNIAQSHGSIPVVDLFGLSDLGQGSGVFTLAGNNNVALAKSQDVSHPDNADPHNFFWSDDFHPTTIMQGIFANSYLTALQEEYPALAGQINLLSSSDILAAAGYSGSFNFDYSQYINVSPTPPAAIGAIVLLLLVWWITTRRSKIRL